MAKNLDSSQILRTENYKGKIPIREVSLMEISNSGNLFNILEEIRKNPDYTNFVSGIGNLINEKTKKNEPIPVKYVLDNSNPPRINSLLYQNPKTLDWDFYKLGNGFRFFE